MSDDIDAILWGIDLAARLGREHPRLAGAALLVLVLIGVPLCLWGFVSANIDREALRPEWPRAAKFFDRGAEVGAFAVAVLKAARRRKSS